MCTNVAMNCVLTSVIYVTKRFLIEHEVVTIERYCIFFFERRRLCDRAMNIQVELNGEYTIRRWQAQEEE